MRVLIAPQEFKGSLSADEAATAIAKGIRLARPAWRRDVLPMSDGGPGLLDAVRHAVRADSYAAVVRDPLGSRVLARYIRLIESGDVVIEAALANGLWHLLPDRLDALNASTEGVGDLLLDAATLEPRRIVVGVGGSATTDGGSGMARALRARLEDAKGREIAAGGGALSKLAAIMLMRPKAFDAINIVVATDVANPLLGPNGAAAVYAPQKGASPEQVATLEAGLANFANVVERDLESTFERSRAAARRAGWRRVSSRFSARGSSRVSRWSRRRRACTNGSPPRTWSSPARGGSTASPCRGR